MPVASTATVASTVLPSLKVTEHAALGAPALVELTAAVKPMLVPDLADVDDAVSAMLDTAGLTVKDKVCEAAAAKLVCCV